VLAIWAGQILYLVAVWCVSLSIFYLHLIICDVFSARCARLSIAVSILRFLSASRDKLVGRVIISLLLSMSGGLLVAKLYHCAQDVNWEKDPLPFCRQPVSFITAVLLCRVSITKPRPFLLIFPLVGTISMLVLIVWPLYLLWGVDLPRKERRLILILFASTIFLAPFVALHAAYSYNSTNMAETALISKTAHTEVSLFFLCVILLEWD
jgi:hypothetical protein